MALLTSLQKKNLFESIKTYKKKYLKKEFIELDESATRLMINSFLTEALNYEELEDIKTEYQIRGTYADYVIQLNKKQHIIVEVKAIQHELSDKHMRQSINYAANEGVDWVLLTNARQFNFYRVILKNKIYHKEIFSIDLTDNNQLNKSADFFEVITKKCVSSGELDKYWKKFLAVEPEVLCNQFYKQEFIALLRKNLKKEHGMSFTDDDLIESVHNIITTEIESTRPKTPIKSRK